MNGTASARTAMKMRSELGIDRTVFISVFTPSTHYAQLLTVNVMVWVRCIFIAQTISMKDHKIHTTPRPRYLPNRPAYAMADIDLTQCVRNLHETEATPKQSIAYLSRDWSRALEARIGTIATWQRWEQALMRWHLDKWAQHTSFIRSFVWRSINQSINQTNTDQRRLQSAYVWPAKPSGGQTGQCSLLIHSSKNPSRCVQ